MQKIFKYELPVLVNQRKCICLADNPIFSVGIDAYNNICLWCTVDETHKPVDVYITIVGTGQEFIPGDIFVGTVIKGRYVWHIYVSLAKKDTSCPFDGQCGTLCGTKDCRLEV